MDCVLLRGILWDPDAPTHKSEEPSEAEDPGLPGGPRASTTFSPVGILPARVPILYTFDFLGGITSHLKPLEGLMFPGFALDWHGNKWNVLAIQSDLMKRDKTQNKQCELTPKHLEKEKETTPNISRGKKSQKSEQKSMA